MSISDPLNVPSRSTSAPARGSVPFVGDLGERRERDPVPGVIVQARLVDRACVDTADRGPVAGGATNRRAATAERAYDRRYSIELNQSSERRRGDRADGIRDEHLGQRAPLVNREAIQGG